MRYISAREARRCVGALVVLVLVAAALNVPAAVMLSVARLTPTKTLVDRRGAAAAARGWPAPTPHAFAWPDPEIWSVASAWPGHRRVKGWATTEGYNTHSVQVDESGWPLPALREVQMWWPWSDPAYATAVPPDPGMRLAWAGVVLNPLLVGGGLWVVAVALPLAVMVWRRAGRDRRGLCVWCGYPRGASEVCSECGRAASGDGGRAVV